MLSTMPYLKTPPVTSLKEWGTEQDIHPNIHWLRWKAIRKCRSRLRTKVVQPSKNEITKLHMFAFVAIPFYDICTFFCTCIQTIHPVPCEVVFTAYRTRYNWKPGSFPCCSIHVIELFKGFIETIVTNQEIFDVSDLASWLAAFNQTF